MKFPLHHAITPAMTLLATSILAASPSLAESVNTTSDEFLEEVVVEGRFIADSGRSGLKSDVPLRDVPLTISGYTNDFMNAIETSRIADLYNYMAGVQKSGNTGYDVSIRGFSSSAADRGVIQTDGLPGLAVRFGSPPTINSERIEVVKGPAAVLYGQIQPGGFINVITKKPQEERKTEVKFRADGTYGSNTDLSETSGATVSLDTTGAIDSGNKFLYRLVAEYEDRDTFRDNSYSESRYIVPSLTWNITDRTQATFFAEYRDEDHALDDNLVAYNNDIDNVAELTTRYQEPDDEQPETGYAGGLIFSHAITNDLLWRLNYRYVWHEDSARGYQNQSFRNATTLRRRDRNQYNERTYNFVDTNLSWDTETGSISHKLMLGFNAGTETSDFERLNFDGGNPTLDIDIYNPVYNQGVPNADRHVSTNDRKRNFDSWAVYIQDQITLTNHWKAVAAIRYEEFDTSEDLYQPIFPVRTYVRTEKANGDDVSTMFGVIYQPDDIWSFYGSYAESFTPPGWGREDANGKQLTTPEKGHQIETGVKAEIENVTATFSIFSITKEDVAQDTGVDSADGDAIWALSGEEQSNGIELEVNANITANWQLIFAYSYVDATVEDDVDPDKVGQTLLNAPKHTASVWNRYQFSDTWGIGMGVKYADERYGSAVAADGNESARLVLPDYVLVDVGVYYTTEELDATLKFGNLLDEEYYESATRNTRIVPGAPANLTLSLTKRF